MDKLAEQVNDELQLKKELNIGDIASKFELPPAFLIGVRTPHAGNHVARRNRDPGHCFSRWQEDLHEGLRGTGPRETQRHLQVPDRPQDALVRGQSLQARSELPRDRDPEPHPGWRAQRHGQRRTLHPDSLPRKKRADHRQNLRGKRSNRVRLDREELPGEEAKGADPADREGGSGLPGVAGFLEVQAVPSADPETS